MRTRTLQRTIEKLRYIGQAFLPLGRLGREGGAVG